jgi:hypothetical protein
MQPLDAGKNKTAACLTTKFVIAYLSIVHNSPFDAVIRRASEDGVRSVKSMASKASRIKL